MTKKERQYQILAILQQEERVTVQQLAAQLAVSVVTIRRDLDDLEKANLLQKKYGGATLPAVRENHNPQPHFLYRSTQNQAKKGLIGAAAAALVDNDDVILLSIGTTCQEVARNLGRLQTLTILTDSFAVLETLADSPFTLLALGGYARPKERAMNGGPAMDTLDKFCVRKAILGAGGITFERGLTEHYRESAELHARIIEQAEQVIVVADSSKLGKNVMSVVAPIDRIDILVTDKEAPDAFVREARERGVRVILADV